MERILHWILKLENELDKQDKTVSDDLKSLKEQFQNHEVMKKRTNRNSFNCFLFVLF